MSGTRTNHGEMPDELSPRRLRRRLLEFAAVGLLIGILVLLGPGLGSLRSQLRHASPGWLAAAVALEILSTLSYVLVFRVVFCRRMSWKLSYQIGMAEQGANSVLSVSGAGGLALGAWALRRGGMSTEYIGRRTVAFFILTSLANVATLIVFAALYALGILNHDRNPALTYGFGIAALVATAVVVLGLPRLRKAPSAQPGVRLGKIAAARRFARDSLGQGVRDGLVMLREHPVGVLAGSFGVMGFDLAVLGFCFRALHYSPPVGVLVVGYLIGQLGGNLPIPGGILGLDGGLIGTFALYKQPLSTTTGAVLLYHGIALWVPGLLGTIAFVRLRRILQREAQPAAICTPLAEPIETVQLPVAAGGRPAP
ncbi:MAG: flippase-like domain-containing protein [Solirubrobacterales bacterium]|nr:flippase-like domain-containing protein [Solirubrobacterales bacterium]